MNGVELRNNHYFTIWISPLLTVNTLWWCRIAKGGVRARLLWWRRWTIVFHLSTLDKGFLEWSALTYEFTNSKVCRPWNEALFRPPEEFCFVSSSRISISVRWIAFIVISRHDIGTSHGGEVKCKFFVLRIVQWSGRTEYSYRYDTSCVAALYMHKVIKAVMHVYWERHW